MTWWLKFTVIWLSIDVLIMIIVWYASTILKPRFPEWWRQVIVDDEPDHVDFYR